MEIRQVLKSSASMIPDLFYKVSHETREMEKSRDSGGKGWKEKRMSRGEGGKKTSMQVDAWKNPHIWREGRSRKGRKRGRIEGKQKERPVKRLAVGARCAKYLCVVGDIEAQADQAGLELLRAQRARVVLGCGGEAIARPGVRGGRGATGHAATHTAVSVKVRTGV